MGNHDHGYGGAHLMLAFIAGAVTGAAAALLNTPQSGPQTRETLKGWANETQGHASRTTTALRGAYRSAIGAARDAFVDALRKDSTDDSEASEPSENEEMEVGQN